MSSRIDPFLPWLQKELQRRQDRRTEVLNLLEPLRKELEDLDKEIELLQDERSRRVAKTLAVPNFPPTSPGDQDEVVGGPDTPSAQGRKAGSETTDAHAEPSSTATEELEDAQRELEQEAIDHYVGPPELEGLIPKSRAYKEATLRLVRDWFVQHRGGWHKTGSIAEDLGVSRMVVAKRCQELSSKGILHNRGNRASSVYSYNEEMPPPPKVKPRGEPHIPGTHNRSGGKAVPYTGRPMVRAGSNEMRVRKAAAKGRKVKQPKR